MIVKINKFFYITIFTLILFMQKPIFALQTETADSLNDTSLWFADEIAMSENSLTPIVINGDIFKTTNQEIYNIAINNWYVKYKYQLDSQSESKEYTVAISNSFILTPTANQSHDLTINYMDKSGEWFNKTYHWTIDTISPIVDIVGIPSNATTITSFTLNLTTNEDDIKYDYSFDNSKLESGNDITDPISKSGLSIGTHSIYITYKDEAGNSNSEFYTWTIYSFTVNNPYDYTDAYLEAGVQSNSFSVTGGNDNFIYEWSLYNSLGKTIVQESNNMAFSYTVPEKDAFAGEYTVSLNISDNFGEIYSKNYIVKVPIQISPDAYIFTDKLDFNVSGAENGSSYYWNILESYNSVKPVEDFEKYYGYWFENSTEENTNTFNTVEIDKIKTFYVKVDISNDEDLTDDNKLSEKKSGPYTIVPIKTFNLTIQDNRGFIDASDFNDDIIIITELVTGKSKSLESYDGKLSFDFPDSGGTYRYIVEDKRKPPVYITETISSTSKTINLKVNSVAQYSITGLVTDFYNSALTNVLVCAYNPFLPDKTFKALTSNGKYTIYLPENAPLTNWELIAGTTDIIKTQTGNANFSTIHKKDISIGTENFTLNDNGYDRSLKANTIITSITPTYNDNTNKLEVKFKIQRPFGYNNNNSNVDITKATYFAPDGDELEQKSFDSQNIDIINDIGFLTAPISFDTVILIGIKTVHNLKTDSKHNSYYAYFYSKDNDNINSFKKIKSIDEVGSSLVFEKNGQKAVIDVPEYGINTNFISDEDNREYNATITFTIEQLKKDQFENISTLDSASGSLDYIYNIYAYETTAGKKIDNNNINKIFITLPIDLKIVKPGDLEKGICKIYRFNSTNEMSNNIGYIVDKSNIVKSDYIGDGHIGSVTFKSNELNIFSIGIETYVDDGTPELYTSQIVEEEGSDCFIKNAASILNFDLRKRVIEFLKN